MPTAALMRVQASQHPHDSRLALLLAGQIRTFEEQPVRRALIRSVIKPYGAAVFAHLSPEHSIAKWHDSTRSDDRPRQTATPLALARLIRDEFAPGFLRIQTDSELIAKQPQWVGHLRGDSRQYSALMLRWLVLLHAIKGEEVAGGGRRFLLVLRIRPDVVLRCTFPPSWVLQLAEGRASSLLAPHSALVSRDFLVLMDRRAADTALAAYVFANTSRDCQLKAELCVPSLLLARNLSVGLLDQEAASIVRPPSVRCSSLAAAGSFDCGRTFLTTVGGSRCCATQAALPWNLTRKRQFWSCRNRSRGGSMCMHL